MDASSWHTSTVLVWVLTGHAATKGDASFTSYELRARIEKATARIDEGLGAETVADAFVHFDDAGLADAGLSSPPRAGVDLIGLPGTTTSAQARRIARIDTQSTKTGYTTHEAILV